MIEYKYFRDVEKNAAFTDIPCEFCGSVENCLDGVYFEDGQLDSICLKCFQMKRARVVIPSFISSLIKENTLQKTKELSETPPVPWIQHNEWPVCCDDYLTYIGEWGQDEFNNSAKNGDGLTLFIEYLQDKLQKEKVQYLWENLGSFSSAFVFECEKCGKRIAVVQEY